MDAIHDHNDIRDAVAAVAGHAVGSDEWYTAVAAANEANGDHMAEEEREGLTDFRRLASLQRRHDLGVAFAAFEARHFAGVTPVDKDPAGYVRAVEETMPRAGGTPRPGRLPEHRQPQEQLTSPSTRGGPRDLTQAPAAVGVRLGQVTGNDHRIPIWQRDGRGTPSFLPWPPHPV